MDWQSFGEKLLNGLGDLGIIALKLIGVFVIGMILIKSVLFLCKKILNKFKIDTAALKFLLNGAKVTLYILLFLVMAQITGIPMTGFIAILSAGGLAVSLALQSSLSNLANGIVIITTKPFKEGDFVRIDTSEGTVKEVKMQYTILSSVDNKEISLPNKTVVESEIVNYNKLGTRKVVINFEINENVELDMAKKVLEKVIVSCDMVYLKPEPFVAFDNIKNNSAVFYTSAWCASDDYWSVYFYILDNGYNELKRANLAPKRNLLDVNLVKEPVKAIRDKPLRKRDKAAPAEHIERSELSGVENIIKNISKRKKRDKNSSKDAKDA